MTEISPEGQGSVEGAQGIPSGQTESTGTPNINPAWNDALGVIPSQLHSQVVPHFQKWDQNFQTKINEVHSQYEPWKRYADDGVSPEDVDYALGLLNALSENPTEVIKALQEWAGAENPEQQGQQINQPQQTDPNADPILSHPKVLEMQQQMEMMAQILLSQRDKEQQAAADEELESDLEELKKQYGDFDEDLVLALAANADEFDYAALEQAVQTVQSKTKVVRQPGPPVLGNGSAPPNEVPKPQNDRDRRAIVAQMLQQAQQQS